MVDFIARYWVQTLLIALTGGMTTAFVMIIALFCGVRALLKDRLYSIYNHYSDKGYCPIYARENAENMFKAYTGLRGNGTIPPLMDKLRELPTDLD